MCFFFSTPATTEIYTSLHTLSLHDALPISAGTITAPLGVRLADWLPSRWLNLIFVVAMLVFAYRMFMSSRGARNDDGLSVAQSGVCKVSKDTGRFIWSLRTVTPLASIGEIGRASCRERVYQYV